MTASWGHKKVERLSHQKELQTRLDFFQTEIVKDHRTIKIDHF